MQETIDAHDYNDCEMSRRHPFTLDFPSLWLLFSLPPLPHGPWALGSGGDITVSCVVEHSTSRLLKLLKGRLGFKTLEGIEILS